METLTTPSQATQRPARRTCFLALGVLLLLLGLAAAGAATLLELSSLLVFGPMLLASGILQVVTAIAAENGKEAAVYLTAAALEAMLGFFIMAQPLLAATNLVVLIAIGLIVAGLVRLARAQTTRSPSRAWACLAGGAALALGVCVGLKLPVAGLWFVGLCIGLDFICHGVSWMVLALVEGKSLQETLP
jgi:uncharacterized membrane protein HdeD (DUF308 family)